ncbi:hypothetical protein K7X08_027915 [Anisodus acutangulus]|uniref:Transmembrane protein n=1 Tax=Anisodus acutangulus TaxID=402998 RepID=A0A9Q1MZT2_9SOLA|nr:hypothetical protein K7X08_027915 [Anisodus acutangulus]
MEDKADREETIKSEKLQLPAAIVSRRTSFSKFRRLFRILKHPALSHLMSRKGNAIVATGLLVFAAAGLSFPFYMATRSSRATPVIDSSKPLPPQATFRGPYVNTGSCDIGPDHQTYPKK